MNYPYSGQSSSRRRTPPASPDEKFVRDILSHSDFSPSESYAGTPTFATAKQSSSAPSKNSGSQGMQEYRPTFGLEGKPLAMVYSPLQSFANLYDEETALMRGTLFSELDLPFEGSKCGKERCGNG